MLQSAGDSVADSSAPDISIRDIAREAGVSVSTVSRVLNGSARVSPDKVARVRAAVARHGYRPNSFSRNLLTGHLRAVGVLVPDLRDEFFGGIVTGIEERLRAHGVQMLCSLGHRDRGEEARALTIFRERELDGLILFADALPDAELLAGVGETPLVLLDRFLPRLAPHCLRLDNGLGGELAARHLLGLGHTRIAHVTGPLHRPDTHDRREGYRRALRGAGLEPDPMLEVVLPGRWNEETGFAATARLLERAAFTALFAGNDRVAYGAVRALRAAGFGVPADVSIVGFDDRPFASMISPGLTTLRYPTFEMGVMAADHLVARVRGETATPLPLLAPELVVRESSGPVGRGNPGRPP